jgi:hypothetical protein
MTTIPSINPTNGWKIYDNSIYKFSIEYPSDWVLIPGESYLMFNLYSAGRYADNNRVKNEKNGLAGVDANISFRVYNSVTEAINSNGDIYPSDKENIKTLEDLAIKTGAYQKKITINGVTGFLIKYKEPPISEIYFQKQETVFDFYENYSMMGEKDDPKTIEEKILNTFKFN